MTEHGMGDLQTVSAFAAFKMLNWGEEAIWKTLKVFRWKEKHMEQIDNAVLTYFER
jgi:hypothetical protein